jgi:AraC-like DNA-binding protein
VNTEFFLNILLFIGGAQGLLLSTALFSVRRGNRKANRILAVLLLIFSILILSHAIGHSHAHHPPSDGHRWMIHAVFFVIAPLLFFYAKALTRYDFVLRIRDSLHLLPSFCAGIAVVLLGNAPHSPEFVDSIDTFILVSIALQMIAYLICMLIILHGFMEKIQNSFSSLEKINLHWLRFFVVSQTVIWPVAFVIDLHKHGSPEMGLVWLLVSIFMYLIGYFGILQPEIFSGEIQEEQLPAQSEKRKYERSTLSPEQAERILERLRTLMESSKPHLIPTLTLPALSKQMGVSPHHLSQIVNEKLKKNFFEFINHYRVLEAKRLLKDPGHQHLTLASIGFEAGFNSVSSFNSIFKKVTSFTPSEYRLSGAAASKKS